MRKKRVLSLSLFFAFLLLLRGSLLPEPPDNFKLHLYDQQSLKVSFEASEDDGESRITSHEIRWGTYSGEREVQKVEIGVNLGPNEVQEVEIEEELRDDIMEIKVHAPLEKEVQVISITAISLIGGWFTLSLTQPGLPKYETGFISFTAPPMPLVPNRDRSSLYEHLTAAFPQVKI